MDILTILFNGLSLSSILLLAALGLAITFGLMGIINMAHGEFIMVGAYTTYVVQGLLMPVLGDGYFFISIVLAFLVAAAFGMALEVTVIRRLYGRPTDSLLATWGVSLILQQLARSIFGAPNVNVVAPAFLGGSISSWASRCPTSACSSWHLFLPASSASGLSFIIRTLAARCGPASRTVTWHSA